MYVYDPIGTQKDTFLPDLEVQEKLSEVGDTLAESWKMTKSISKTNWKIENTFTGRGSINKWK